MEARQTILQPLFEGTKQFQAPLYQRRYAWKQTQWDGLWKNILTQYQLSAAGSGAASTTHFLGSFVLAPVPGPQSTPAKSFIVDGQQRLTTLFALLCALRDAAAREHHGEYERFNNLYLHNQYQEGGNRFRLVLTEDDRGHINSIVENYPAQPSGLVGAAYQFFANRIETRRVSGDPLNLALFEETIFNRIMVVEITAQHGDNVHRIFQTLNSTGVDLDQVDLLRNHFFMLLSARGERAYRQIWQPMEARLGNRSLDFFLWVDLVRAGHDGINRDEVYRTWQEELEPIEHHEEAVEGQMQELADRSEQYAKLVEPSFCEEPPIAARLARLKEWGTGTASPLLLHLLVEHEAGRYESSDIAQAMLYVESYLVRRLLARIPTNNLNRIFSGIVSSLPARDSIAVAVREALSGPGKYWPSDEDLLVKVQTVDFYRAQRPFQRQYVLRRLEESFNDRERLDWEGSDLTLEHIMPQNLSEEWYRDLEESGENPLEVHRELLHTIGNVTLTGYNPQLSDKPFERKQQIYEMSRLEMNRRLTQTEKWRRVEVLARSALLGQAAIGIWPGPLPGSPGTEEAGPDWERAESALAALPEGNWTSYTALSEFMGLPTQVLIHSVREGELSPQRHRILRGDGRIDTEARWVANNVVAHVDRLLAEGIIEDRQDARGAWDRYVDEGGLLELIGEA